MKMSVFKIFLSIFISVIIFVNLFVSSCAEFVILSDRIPFEVYTGNGSVSVSLCDNEKTAEISERLKSEDFIRFVESYRDFEMTENYYDISEKNGVAVITFKEEFLQTLEDGAYYFFAEFSKAQIPLVLYVVTEKTTSSRVFEFDAWNWTDEKSPRVYISFYECDTFLSADLFEAISINGKELDASAYTVSEGGNGVSVTLNKNYLRTLPTGEHYFDIDFLNVEGIRFKITVPPVCVAGDYNGDGKTSASDARNVLRVAAKLDKANETQIVRTDIDADGRLTASDARRVLRISAKIDSVKIVTVTLDRNMVFETPVMTNNVMNQWVCDIPDNSPLICERSNNIPATDPMVIGGGYQRFTFSSAESGVYNARFKYVVGWKPDSAPSDEIYYIFTVK